MAPSLPRGTERSEEHTSELQSRQYLVCRLLLEKKNTEKESFSQKLPACRSYGTKSHPTFRFESSLLGRAFPKLTSHLSKLRWSKVVQDWPTSPTQNTLEQGGLQAHSCSSDQGLYGSGHPH